MHNFIINTTLPVPIPLISNYPSEWFWRKWFCWPVLLITGSGVPILSKSKQVKMLKMGLGSSELWNKWVLAMGPKTILLFVVFFRPFAILWHHMLKKCPSLGQVIFVHKKVCHARGLLINSDLNRHQKNSITSCIFPV